MEEKERYEKDDFEDLYYKSIEQRKDLEAKLAESESKRKSLEEKVKFLTEEIEECFVDGQKYNELREQKDKEIAKLKQSQKQLVIEKLEKIKNYFDDSNDDKYNESEGWIITNRNVVNYINSQIKELKGEE